MKAVSKIILVLGFISVVTGVAQADCVRNIVTVRDSKISGEANSLKVESLLTSLEKSTEKLTLLQAGVTAVVAPKSKDDHKAISDLKKITGVTVSCLTYQD